ADWVEMSAVLPPAERVEESVVPCEPTPVALAVGPTLILKEPEASRERIFSTPPTVSLAATNFWRPAALDCCKAGLMAVGAESRRRPLRLVASLCRIVLSECGAPVESLAVTLMV